MYEEIVIECVIQHEMMHIILNDKGLRDDKRLRDCYNRAIRDGDIFRISYRASKNEREFLSEAAVMLEHGEPLPEYIQSMVKEIKAYEA